jgi:uncharacterized membrane protein YkoI
MRLSTISLAAATLTLSPAVWAFDMPETKVSMETCMKAALGVRSGHVKRLQLETEDGKVVYEFSIRTDEGYVWELECDATTGEIIDVERNSSPNDAVWKRNAKLLAKQARDIALQAHPGKAKGEEREVRGDGRVMWEVEIIGADGREIEVHVDAVSGEILSTEHEAEQKTFYTIGSK